MAEHTTPRYLLGYPDPTGEVALGAKDLQELATEIDEINSGEQDFLSAGCPTDGDWGLVTLSVNSSTGVLSSSAETGGVAWGPDPVLSGALMRTKTPNKKLSGLTPPSLPSPGKFLAAVVELTPATWDAAAALSVAVGSQQATAIAAFENPPATTSGKIKLFQIIIANVGGSYQDGNVMLNGTFDVRSGISKIGAYETGIPTARSSETFFLPSQTQNTQVSLIIASTSAGTTKVDVTVRVAKVLKGTLFGTEATPSALTLEVNGGGSSVGTERFIVPAGYSWKWESSNIIGSPSTVAASVYLPLGPS